MIIFPASRGLVNAWRNDAKTVNELEIFRSIDSKNTTEKQLFNNKLKIFEIPRSLEDRKIYGLQILNAVILHQIFSHGYVQK